MKKFSLFLTLATLLFTHTAHADVGILGGVTMENPSYKLLGTKISTSSDTGLTGGLYFAGNAAVVGAELDVLYANHKFSAVGIERNLNAVEVPLFLRIGFVPIFNIGLGGYYGRGLSGSYNSLGLDKDDYGLIGSAQLKIPFAGSVSFVIDGRYQYGLKNLLIGGNSNNEFFNRGIEILAGFGFGT